jgi:hypothetical protein
MPKHVLNVCILPEEYDAFVGLAPVDKCFPATYDEWFEGRAKKNAKSLARGDILDEVILHPEEFAKYARSVGQPLSEAIFIAAAGQKARR